MASAKAGGVPAICLADFDGGGHKHAIALKRGTRVTLLNDEGTEWWFGCDDETREEGYFPAKFIHKLDYELDPRWRVCVSHHAQVYYYDTVTGESTWQLPGSGGSSGSLEAEGLSLSGGSGSEADGGEGLPEGWKIMKSHDGHIYYYSTVTHQSQWERPDNKHTPDHAGASDDEDDGSAAAPMELSAEERERRTAAIRTMQTMNLDDMDAMDVATSGSGDESKAGASAAGSGSKPPMAPSSSASRALGRTTSMGHKDGPATVRARSENSIPPSPEQTRIAQEPETALMVAKNVREGSREQALKHALYLLCQGCTLKKKMHHESSYHTRFIFLDRDRGLLCWAKSEARRDACKGIPLLSVKAIAKRPPLKARRADRHQDHFAKATFSVITSEAKIPELDLWCDTAEFCDAITHALLIALEGERMRVAGVSDGRQSIREKRVSIDLSNGMAQIAAAAAEAEAEAATKAAGSRLSLPLRGGLPAAIGSRNSLPLRRGAPQTSRVSMDLTSRASLPRMQIADDDEEGSDGSTTPIRERSESEKLRENAKRLSLRVQSGRYQGGLAAALARQAIGDGADPDVPAGGLNALRHELRSKISEQLKTEIHQFATDGFANGYFAQQKRGFFSRAATGEELISFSARPITQAVTKIDEESSPELAQEAVGLFRDIMRYMGDDPRDKQSEGSQNLREQILSVPTDERALRAEAYCQVLKQTHSNPSPESEMRGWELLACLSKHFTPPDNDLRLFALQHADKTRSARTATGALALFFYSNTARREADVDLPPEEQFLTQDEINDIKTAFLPADLYDSCSLEQMLLFENSALSPAVPPAPGTCTLLPEVPRVIAGLCAAVMELGGAEQTGIFRLSANADTLARLRTSVGRMDLSELVAGTPGMNSLIPADLLKQLLRSMSEPIIPFSLYDRCVEIGRKANCKAETVEVMKDLRPANQVTLYTLVRFMGELSRSSDVTQMGVDNLALVFAPNLLKSENDDPLLFAANSGDERNFIAQLVYAQLEGLWELHREGEEQKN